MPKAKYVLAIDQGTTGTHVSVVDARGKVVGKGYREFRQIFPKPGWVEHDLEDIWGSVERTVAEALKDSGLKGTAITAIGITNQRETTAVWHRGSGKAIQHAIVWQDRRTSERCAEIKARGLEPRIRELTGLVVDPYFSGTKVEWILRNKRGARARAEKGDLCFGTIDSYLVYKLTGHRTHVTDVSNASRTLLMDLRKLQWSEELRRLFDVPALMLPEIRSSAEIYGTTSRMKSLPDGIPISGMAGDQQAALFGQACFERGASKCTYGTGAFLLMNTGTDPVVSRAGCLTTVGWKIGNRTTYALEGAAFIAAAAVQWLRDGLGLIKSTADVERLAAQVKDSGEVAFVPALAGLGAPHWRPEARGLFCGIDRSTTRAHLARAVLEGVALQIHDLAEAMKTDSGKGIPYFRVDGGAAANNLMMQYQADVLGVPVTRPKDLQTTSLGAAYLGGIGAGVWDGTEQIHASWKAEKTFAPKMSGDIRAWHLNKWKRAVERA
jgi:glycerol kinase